ncbi:MAG: HEAT repeat domain-containing protein, partial [Methanobacterium sp.]|nr:HEAT repeat domain-containing protein [Methanobacterium sp.]
MVSIEDINQMGIYGDIEGLINSGLNDPEPEVRTQSVIALVNIGDEKFIDFLITTLESSDNHIGRTIAAEALGNTARILKENENILMQQSLDKSVVPLINALNDDSYEVRGLVSWALGNIGDPRAVEPLIKTLDD